VPYPRVSFRLEDEQWEAIRSLHKNWPDDIYCSDTRDVIERLGRMFLLLKAQRSHLGAPVKIRDRLRTTLRLLRELQAAVNALPYPLPESSPDFNLEEQERWLQGWLDHYEYYAGPRFRGRKDPYRHWLELGLLAVWIELLGGTPSFSRKLDGTPYGPLIEFLRLAMNAITGSAPSPAAIAKIIEQYRKRRYFPD
jgi:hypothetical protein